MFFVIAIALFTTVPTKSAAFREIDSPPWAKNFDEIFIGRQPDETNNWSVELPFDTRAWSN